LSPERFSGGSVALDPVFPALKKVLIERTGLSYYADKDADLASIVDARLAALEHKDGAVGYLQLLSGRSGEDEIHEIVNRLTIGETYFFRHAEQFDTLRDVVFPDILNRNQHSRTLRVWSAGCASGAEPYSVSILLRRDLAHLTAGWDIRIVGTDINAEFLESATGGTYGEWALRTVPDPVRQQCFRAVNGKWEIAPGFRAGVSFCRHNLVSGAPPPLGGAPDLIICRNVMIYFNQEMTTRLAEHFHTLLPDWGWLVVGHSELNGEHFRQFATKSAPSTTFYQKSPGTPDAAVAGRVPTNLPPTPIVDDRAVLSGLTVTATQSESDSGDVATLIAAGDWVAARLLADRLLGLDQINPLGHYLKSVILENAGLVEEAERSLRNSIYLDRGFTAAHYALGTLLEKHGDLRGAARSYGTAVRTLAAAPPESEPLPLSDTSASTLLELLEAALQRLQTE
jgi:chemotaxis protein methyltransferase CheR